MSDPLSRIRRSLDALAARERRLLGAQAGIQLGVAGAASLLLLAGLYSAGVARDVGLGAAIFTLVLTCILALAMPAAFRWRAAGEARSQGRLVEGLRPAVRGRLLAAIDRAPEPGAKPAPAGVSQVLLARASSKAADALDGVPPSEVHPMRPVGRSAAVLGASVLLLLLGGAFLPVGPLDALAVAAGESAAAARLESGAAVVADQEAVVGDITLRYVFPDYTGIEPVEVPNSDGAIHAPPGTLVEISARTAGRFDAVALEVAGQEPVDATLVDGRDVRTGLTVAGEGTWRLVLFSGNEIQYSPSYVINAEDDAAPVVALERAPAGGVAQDKSLGLGWSAQDDFGLNRVVLEIEREDGTVEERVLREPLDPTARLAGGVRLSPRRLGLKAGETVKLRVAAYDNDLQGGSKRGVSAEVEVTVLGPQGRGRQLRQQAERLRNLMLDALAESLVESVPPARGELGMTRWAASARERLQPIQQVRREIWGDARASGLQAELVDEVLEDGARLFRFTLTTWEPGSGRRVTDGDVAAFARMHAEHIDGLERGIYVLDQMLQQVAQRELAQQLQAMANEAGELAEMAQNLEAPEILARLDQLERLMSRMSQLASKLDEGSLKEFVNARSDEARSLMDEIRKAVAEGRMDDARDMLDDLAQRLQQMSENIQDSQAQRQQGEDELGEAFDEAMDELEKLADDQDALAEELAEAREKLGGGVDAQIALWREVDKLSRQAEDSGAEMPRAAGDGTGFRAESVRWFERLAAGTSRVRDAVSAREPLRALESMDKAAGPLRMADRMAQLELERARPAGEPIPAGAAAARAHGQGVRMAFDKMRPILQQLAQSARTEPAAVREAAREMADRQAELEQRAQALQGDVRRVEQAMPASDGKASQAMQEAGDAMERAGEALEEGRGMQGQGHQLDAASRVREAREQLERQMQNHQQMQQSIGQMQGEQQPGGGGEGEGEGEELPDGDGNREDGGVELPLAEDFQTPEAYRRALLEGMESDVPDEYEALKRRYYEELVRQ
jgi:hypothetical protein